MVGKGLSTRDDMEGGYKSWSKDATHRREAKVLGIFRDIWPDRNGPLPWRLTKEQLKVLDERMKKTVWPHYLDPLFYEGCSFWVKPGRLWKSRRKSMLLCFLLSTQIRDMVPALREAIDVFVWALRQLDGQVHSYDAAQKLGVLPGSRVIDKRKLKEIHKALIRGLSLLEGALPPSHLNPGMHHFVHYVLYTQTHALLRVFWMFGFERFVLLIVRLCCSIDLIIFTIHQVQQEDEESRARCLTSSR